MERLQAKLEMMEAKHASSLRQTESRLRMELELKVSQAKDDGLRRLADNEMQLQQSHQRQLSDVVSDHNRQTGQCPFCYQDDLCSCLYPHLCTSAGEMKERFRSELNRVKSHYEHKVSVSHRVSLSRVHHVPRSDSK